MLPKMAVKIFKENLYEETTTEALQGNEDDMTLLL